MDGARLWNASVAQNVNPSILAGEADTVSVCFSKGLGAPVGSALTGTKEFIAEALRVRKMLGGGMRQAGILAAGALYALEHHVKPLADDHLHARMLADTLEASGWADVPVKPETNIVFAQTLDATPRPSPRLCRSAGCCAAPCPPTGSALLPISMSPGNRRTGPARFSEPCSRRTADSPKQPLAFRRFVLGFSLGRCNEQNQESGNPPNHGPSFLTVSPIRRPLGAGCKPSVHGAQKPGSRI